MKEFRQIDFKELLGKTITFIDVIKNEYETNLGFIKEEYKIVFIDSEGYKYEMLHFEDCCEEVYIEDICGNLDDLLNTPIVLAEEVSNSNDKSLDEYEESYTWTYYKLATINGYVTIRWYGSSNGYYSEEVSFIRYEK